MAAAADIRNRIYDNLYGSFPTDTPFVTTLTATYTDAEGVIDVLDEENWEVGDVVENTATGEQMKVLSVTTDGSDILTVVHGWAGTATAAAVASDDVLYKNPRFTQKKLDDSVTATLLDLGNWGIHVFGTGTITRADPITTYDIADTDIVKSLGILKLYIATTDSELIEVLPFRWFYNIDTTPTVWDENIQLHVLDFGTTKDTDKLFYTYAQEISTTALLLPRQEELIVVGATAIVMGSAIAPATQDPGARTDRTVQPGQMSRDVRFFQGQFFTGIRHEAAVLSVERQKMIQEIARFTRARRWVN